MIKRNNLEALGSHESQGSGAAAGLIESWRLRLADLAIACAGAYAEDEGTCLRDIHDLLAAAPQPFLIAGLAMTPESRLEQLIASEGASSAALGMLGADCGFLLSRGGAGTYLASVVLPGDEQDVSACGDTAALALIGAVARALASAGQVSALRN